MLACFRRCFTAAFLGMAAQPICSSPQCDLPQCRQIIPDKKVIQRTGSLLLLIDFSFPQTLDQIVRLNIHQLHLIGRVKYRIRNTLAHRYLCNGGHQVVQRFQMLHIDGGVYIDSGPQQLLNILIPFEVAASCGIAVCQLVHQNQLWVPFQCSIQVKLPKVDAAVFHLPGGQLFQSFQQSQCVRTGVSFDIANYHIYSLSLCQMRCLKHGKCFTDSSCIAEENLQPPCPGHLLPWIFHACPSTSFIRVSNYSRFSLA